MSCWVVPAVAAEFWGVPVQTVLNRVRDGQVPHKTDQGFLFVDVAPWSVDAVGVCHSAPPQTFVPAAVEEEPMPNAEPWPQDEDLPLLTLDADDAEQIEEAHTEDLNWLNREQTREAVSRMRRPPVAA